jgi:hypothetical protein
MSDLVVLFYLFYFYFFQIIIIKKEKKIYLYIEKYNTISMGKIYKLLFYL